MSQVTFASLREMLFFVLNEIQACEGAASKDAVVYILHQFLKTYVVCLTLSCRIEIEPRMEKSILLGLKKLEVL